MPIKTDDKNQLIPPSDFDENLRLSVSTKVEKQHAKHPNAYTEFIQSWGAVQYRFYACTEHDEAFTESVQLHLDSPMQPHRYQQEKELFNFFMNGLSCIECMCYGLFSIGAMIDPTQFPFGSDKERQLVTPKKTSDCYNAAFPKEKLSVRLGEMLDSRHYKDWHNMRRFLFHRIHPGRVFKVGVSTAWIMGKSIDQNTTAIPRKWLASTVKELLTLTDSFVATRL